MMAEQVRCGDMVSRARRSQKQVPEHRNGHSTQYEKAPRYPGLLSVFRIQSPCFSPAPSTGVAHLGRTSLVPSQASIGSPGTRWPGCQRPARTQCPNASSGTGDPVRSHGPHPDAPGRRRRDQHDRQQRGLAHGARPRRAAHLGHQRGGG